MTETVTMEKQVWESTLNRSMVLQAENAQLKKWCEEFNALEVAKENTKLKTDCRTLAQKLLQVKPELREWLEVNFKEYL